MAHFTVQTGMNYEGYELRGVFDSEFMAVSFADHYLQQRKYHRVIVTEWQGMKQKDVRHWVLDYDSQTKRQEYHPKHGESKKLSVRELWWKRLKLS